MLLIFSCICFGSLEVNGGSVVGAVFNPILQTLSAGNIAGEHHIVCQQFQDLFIYFGGQDPTLSRQRLLRCLLYSVNQTSSGI